MKRLSLLCLSLILPMSAQVEELSPQLDAALREDLAAFAAEHSLSGVQLEGMLGRLIINGKRIPKGGVGIIDEDTFIILGASQNSLEVSGKPWTGKPSSQQELVFTNGQQVFHATETIDMSRATLVLFLKDEVRYIDFARATAGRYPRTLNSREQ